MSANLVSLVRISSSQDKMLRSIFKILTSEFLFLFTQSNIDEQRCRSILISGVTTSEESIFTYVGLADWYSFVEGSEWQPVLQPTFPEGIVDLTEDDVSGFCWLTWGQPSDWMR